MHHEKNNYMTWQREKKYILCAVLMHHESIPAAQNYSLLLKLSGKHDLDHIPQLVKSSAQLFDKVKDYISEIQINILFCYVCAIYVLALLSLVTGSLHIIIASDHTLQTLLLLSYLFIDYVCTYF